jgi:ribonucleoside-diphosphate reductase alpha chain
MDVNRRGIQPRWMKNKSASSNIKIERATEALPEERAGEAMTAKACSLLDPTCEACQ